MKICLFTINDRILFYNQYKTHVPTYTIFPHLSKLLKIFRIFINRYLSKLAYIFYTKEFLNSGYDYDCLIIFDSSLTVAPANFMKHKFPNLRIIYWYWNHIRDYNRLNYLDKGIEKWTYDPEDSIKHQIRFNSQFYFPELANLPSLSYPQYDCYFIGSDKGRRSNLNSLIHLLNIHNISHKFIIVSDTDIRLHSNRRSYSEIIKDIRNSKCIIDILPPEQTGISLRPLEALYFKKKLITNCKFIKSEIFYNNNNIFIIGEDNEDDLFEFVNSNYIDVPNNIIEYYSFKSWLTRFN